MCVLHKQSALCMHAHMQLLSAVCFIHLQARQISINGPFMDDTLIQKYILLLMATSGDVVFIMFNYTHNFFFFGSDRLQLLAVILEDLAGVFNNEYSCSVSISAGRARRMWTSIP